MSRPFAVFDIDGTLIRWQLYHALADELVKRGLIDADRFQKVREARMTWKTRTHESSFQDYETTLITLIDGVIANIEVNKLRDACQEVIEQYKDQVYTFTRDLIEDLRHKDYLLFAISGSQAEIVGMLAHYYGFDDYGGSKYETRDGKFTGRKDLLISTRKPEYLQDLVTKHGATYRASVGVGDSEGDIPMLSKVEQPIAFNPTKLLFEHAQTKQWKVVVERKNMTYQLELRNDAYQLVD